MVFSCSPEDARHLEDHFAPHLSAHDLSHLPAFAAACRPCISGENGTPFTFTTLPLPEGSRDRALEARIRSGEVFGVARGVVEKEIRTRHVRPEVTLLPGGDWPRPPDPSSDPSPDQPPDRSPGAPGAIDPEEGEEGGEAA